MEAKKQRGRPPAAGGRAAQPRELSLQSYISSIIKIEGQRCAIPPCTCTQPPPHGIPPPSHPVRRFCDPTKVPMLHAGRCIPAEQSKPSYLVLGMFKTSAEHPGFPDKRWLTLSELKAAEGMQIADIKSKLAEYEAASKAAADLELDAALAPAPEGA